MANPEAGKQGLRVSPSSLKSAAELNPEVAMYAAAIQAFDRDGNGELDLHEIAAAVKALADARAQNKMLKTAVIVAGVCSLLIVAAVVGLTFAVVTLVKDTKMDNNVMVNKETGAPVEVRNMDLSVVGGALTSPGSEDTLATSGSSDLVGMESIVALLSDNSTDEADLANYVASIQTIQLPASNGTRFSVHHVAAVAVTQDGALVIYTQDGQQVIYDANGISLDGPSGRRLLGWWSSAVSWVSKNVVKPIEKAVVKPIVNIANQIAAGATDAWNKTENWVTDAANTAYSFMKTYTVGVYNDLSACVTNPEKDWSKCAKYVPCLNIAKLDSGNPKDASYWKDTGNQVKNELDKCTKGDLLLCKKYAVCLQKIVTAGIGR